MSAASAAHNGGSGPDEEGNRVGKDGTDAAAEESVPDQRAVDGAARDPEHGGDRGGKPGVV
jgi:hypothetical protein